MEYNAAGPFRVTHTSIIRVNGTAITCPTCGCGTGLVLFAVSANEPVVAECPRNHSWTVPAISFAQVRDTYVASLAGGRMTR